MMHPDTELRLVSPSVGYGVFAARRIPRGTVTWVLDELDLVLTPERVASLPAPYQPILARYAFVDGWGRHVLCWDFGRFMNHSCVANCACVGSLCDIAARDIEAGEQLTCEYGILNMAEEFACRCGAATCRATVGQKTLAEHAAEIDRTAAAAAREILRVPQPLLGFMRPADRHRLDAITGGAEPFPSCLENLRA